MYTHLHTLLGTSYLHVHVPVHVHVHVHVHVESHPLVTAMLTDELMNWIRGNTKSVLYVITVIRNWIDCSE